MKKEYLTVNDIAELLSVSPKTIRKYVWQKTIPYLKINGHIRFEKVRIDEWLEEKQVLTIDEIRYGISYTQRKPAKKIS